MDERERLIGEIVELHRDTARVIHRGMSLDWLEADLTMPQFKTLCVIYNKGRVSMGELAEALGTGVSTVTGIVDRLVDHGLVSREEAPYDRRVVVGRLTSKGLNVVERLYLAAQDRQISLLSQLSLDELRLVARAFSLLRDTAARAFPAALETASNQR